MLRLSKIPDGLEAIKEYYGDPDADGNLMMDDGFSVSNLRTYMLPVPMRLAWDPARIVTRFRAHALVGFVIMDALRAVYEEMGRERMDQLEWNRWAGCWWFRPKRTNGRELSLHSWGIAVDLNPDLEEQPDPIIRAFEDRGFVHGRLFSKPDPMHFQAAIGY